MTVSIEFDAPLITGSEPGAWTYAIVPDSAEVFGTRKPLKVHGTVDGEPVAVTLLPMGDGTHMLPLRAAVRTRLGKQAGDLVRAHLHARSAG
jgi:Domain of unknown function (DUF1905)